MDEIRQGKLEEEKLEELKEVIHIEEDEDETNEEDEGPTPQLYGRILSDKERRKMEKVQAKAEKDAEKERKKAEMEALKGERDQEKEERKTRATVPKLKPMEMSSLV